MDKKYYVILMAILVFVILIISYLLYNSKNEIYLYSNKIHKLEIEKLNIKNEKVLLEKKHLQLELDYANMTMKKNKSKIQVKADNRKKIFKPTFINMDFKFLSGLYSIYYQMNKENKIPNISLEFLFFNKKNDLVYQFNINNAEDEKKYTKLVPSGVYTLKIKGKHSKKKLLGLVERAGPPVRVVDYYGSTKEIHHHWDKYWVTYSLYSERELLFEKGLTMFITVKPKINKEWSNNTLRKINEYDSGNITVSDITYFREYYIQLETEISSK